MYIEQDKQTGEFMLMNPPRQIRLAYEQAKWIIPDFYDQDFDFEKANLFYNLNQA